MTMEEFRAEMRGMAQDLDCVLERREGNQGRRFEDSRDSVNGGRERQRQREGSDDDVEEERGDVHRNWMKRVELHTFEGTDPMGWIVRAEKFFEIQNV